jgi:hypothetical protein
MKLLFRVFSSVPEHEKVPLPDSNTIRAIAGAVPVHSGSQFASSWQGAANATGVRASSFRELSKLLNGSKPSKCFRKSGDGPAGVVRRSFLA